MKIVIFLLSSILLFACSEPKVNHVTSLPQTTHQLSVDSINSKILLNPRDVIATSDYLIIANSLKDTIFDVFDIKTLDYLYSDVCFGGAPNEMLNFRNVEYLNENTLYAVGLGVPMWTKINVADKMIVENHKIEDVENGIIQNMYLLNNKVLFKCDKEIEWKLYDMANKNLVDLPNSPFWGHEPQGNKIELFKYRAVNVAVKNDFSKFAFFNSYLPYVRMFDSEGSLIHDTFVEKTPDDYYNLLLDKKHYYSRCCATDEYIFVRCYLNDSKDLRTTIQVWDWNANLLSLIELDNKLGAFTVSPDGNHLYGVKIDSDYIYYCDLSGLNNSLQTFN